MSYCFNNECLQPANKDTDEFCHSCGAKLLLVERFRAIKLIGQGGMSQTFLAVDEMRSPFKPCVIKQFAPQQQLTLFQKKTTELFKQESRLLEDLGKHPQIPTLIASFIESDRYYIVQEFIDGINLAEAIAINGTFSETQIWQLLNELLPVIKFIHDLKIIHRDIKPENIIKRVDNKLFLVDFGAAKLVTETDNIQTGTSIGSAEYVAPEQAKGKAVFASDLYSLGVTCLYLLTGISPFDLFDVANNCWTWQQWLPEMPHQRGNISDRLAKILDKLVENALNQRFQSVDEVIKAINLTIRNKPYQNLTVKPEPTNQWQCQYTLTDNSNLSSINAIAISPDGEIIVSASDDNLLRLWDIKTGKFIKTISAHSDVVKSVAFSPDGKILASASDDKTIKLWDATQEEIGTLKGHNHAVKSVSFSPNNKIIATGSWDKTIKLWDIDNQQLIATLSGHQLQISAVAFSPVLPSHEQWRIGGILASASFDRTIKVWDLYNNSSAELTPKIRYTLRGHNWPVFAIAFSPKNSIMASGSDDKTINLWDLTTGKLISTISGHSWSVSTLVFSPDGETLISGSWDNTIKLWNVNTGEEIATLKGHLDSVNTVAIHPQGKIIVSGSRDNTIKIWQYSQH